MPQQFIDVELLKSYPTASEETKRLLESIYGVETFGLFTEEDKFKLLAAIAKEFMENGGGGPEAVAYYPYSWKGRVWNLKITIERNEMQSEKGVVSWDSIFDNFKSIKNKRFWQ